MITATITSEPEHHIRTSQQDVAGPRTGKPIAIVAPTVSSFTPRKTICNVINRKDV